MFTYAIRIDLGTYAHLEPKSCAKMIEQVPAWDWSYTTPNGNKEPYQVPPGVVSTPTHNGKRIRTTDPDTKTRTTWLPTALRLEH